MTNAIVTMKIATVLTTNWVTVSRTSPVVSPSEMVHAVYRPVMANQVGAIFEDKIGRFDWNKDAKEVLLERKQVGRTERSIDEGPVFPPAIHAR